MDKDYVEFHFRPLREVKEEIKKEGNASPPTNYLERMKAMHGEVTGEIDLEAEIY